MTSNVTPAVLDPAQLQRIQGLHRGMLFQHLYAVCCLLHGPVSGLASLRTERDEDIELVQRDGVTTYVQVKTRKDSLVPSDISDVWPRFEELRRAHATGQRTSVPRFAIATNVESGPAVRALALPPDTAIITPSTDAARLADLGLVAPAPSLGGMISTALELAEGHRLSVLRPETLVAKLVGLVAHAASGHGPTVFLVEDLTSLCELFLAQVRPLPVVSRYRPHAGEPTFHDSPGPLVVVGHAGDGKSTWAAQLASHTRECAVYLACSPEVGQQLAPALVDAAVATLVARGTVRAHELVLPGRTGLLALSLLEQEVARRGLEVVAIVDDSHNLRSDTVVAAMRAAPSFRWVLLGHPSQALSEVCALNTVEPVTLGGWSDDTLAELLAEADCLSGPNHVADLRRATAGAPLFVVQAIRAIAARGGDTTAYVRAISAGVHEKRTPQEILLEGAASGLDPDCGRVASALASVQLSLTPEQWIATVAPVLGLSESAVRRTLRELADLHVVSLKEGGVAALFDVFRPVLEARFITTAETSAVRERIADSIRTELLQGRSREKIIAFVGILASLGRLSEIADLVNAIAEWIRETGAIDEIREHLEAVLNQAGARPEDRFWVEDALAFFDLEAGDVVAAQARVTRMALLASHLPDVDQDALLHKRLMVEVGRRDIAAIRRLARSCPSDSPYSLIIRYAAGAAEAQFGDFKVGTFALISVADAYLARLGLASRDLLARNIPELMRMVSSDASRDDIQHLADCYDAMYKAARVQRQSPDFVVMFAIWAAKFYAMAGADRSALIANREVVEIMLRDQDDPRRAREFLERTLLPAAVQAKQPDLLMSIRGQYAVACAHCDDFVGARAAIHPLMSYVNGLAPAGKATLERQWQEVEDLAVRGPLSPSAIAAREAKLAKREIVANDLRRQIEAQRAGLLRGPPATGKSNRNGPCPCGSGKKYKKCHGLS